MLLIPAIDLQDGKCVRLKQGDRSRTTVYSDNPVATAGAWVKAGARRLHIVDLDGAADGKPVNLDAIEAVIRAHPEIPVQVGGGIRDEETIETYVGAGARFVIIGTRAVNNPHFVSDVCAEFPSHIIVALDAKDGRVAIDGWSKLASHDLVDLAQQFEDNGVEAIIFTDVGRDGMLEGINVEATAELARSIRIPVIAAGGLRDIDDVRALCAVSDTGIEGVVVGRSIYEGTLDLAEGQKLADKLSATYG